MTTKAKIQSNPKIWKNNRDTDSVTDCYCTIQPLIYSFNVNCAW